MKAWTSEDAKKAAERIRAGRAVIQPERLTHITITLDRLLPGLNGSNGLIRQHYRKATAVKDELLEWMKSQRIGTFGKARVAIVCTRHYCGLPMDSDNLAASFKYPMDAVVKAGIIADDGPKCAAPVIYCQKKCPSRKMQKMTIEITSSPERAKQMLLDLIADWQTF